MGFGFCFVSVVYTGIVFLSVLKQDSQMVFCFGLLCLSWLQSDPI